MLRLALAAVVAFACCGEPLCAELQTLLRRPPSPGVVALLIAHAGEPGVAERLAEALKDRRPETRAAAARAIDVTKASALLRELRSALETETNPEAAREIMRALAYLGTADEDQRLLDAARRLGDPMNGVVAGILARARGASSLELIASPDNPLRLSDHERLRYAIVASGREGEAMLRLVDHALQTGALVDWIDVLSSRERLGMEIDPPHLSSALRHTSPKIRSWTAWHFAHRFAEFQPDSPAAFLAAIPESAASPDDGASSEAEFGAELLARVLGRAPVERPAWIAYLDSMADTATAYLDPGHELAAYLTKAERKACRRTFGRLHPSWIMPSTPALPSRKPRRGQGSHLCDAVHQPARLASGYPSGFVSDVLTQSGCVLSEAPALSVAVVNHDRLGRSARVSLDRTPPAPGCRRAAETLFAASLLPDDDVANPEAPTALFLVLEKGTLSRLETDSTLAGVRFIGSSDAEDVTLPERTQFVKPLYPESAMRGSREGKVVVEILVDREGLVGDLTLQSCTDPGFVASAIVAISRWRYKPASFGGLPVPVLLTVMVEYNMH